jgi:hypothetical protein
MSSSYNSTSQSDETRPLLASPVPSAASEVQDQGDGVPARLANHIYVSHFLSTWNSRVFEFGGVLYLATIFPGTLLPMSVYALARGLSAILFAPAVGQYIDTSNRLQVVRLSIGEHHRTPFMEKMIPLQFCSGWSLRDLVSSSTFWPLD